MRSDYLNWISEKYPTSESAELQCKEATLKMAEEFTELDRVRGIAHIKEPHGLLPTRSPHWWLITKKGEIIDPVAHQYPYGIVKYKQWDEELGEPTGKCMNCGDLCFKNHNVCSEKCAEAMG